MPKTLTFRGWNDIGKITDPEAEETREGEHPDTFGTRNGRRSALPVIIDRGTVGIHDFEDAVLDGLDEKDLEIRIMRRLAAMGINEIAAGVREIDLLAGLADDEQRVVFVFSAPNRSRRSLPS